MRCEQRNSIASQELGWWAFRWETGDWLVWARNVYAYAQRKEDCQQAQQQCPDVVPPAAPRTCADALPTSFYAQLQDLRAS